MKKIKNMKLMLLGFLAMGSVNVFADSTNGTLKFAISGTNAEITGFAADVTDRSTVEIPSSIKDLADGKTYTVTSINADAFVGDKAKIKTVVIKATGVKTIPATLFSNSAVESIDLTAATGITTIEAGAFAGTKISILYLSKTKVGAIYNLFGSYTKYDTNEVKYSAEEAYAANVAARGAAAVTTAMVKTPGVYDDESAAAYNAKLEGAIKAGDDLLYSKASANEYNQTTYPAAGFVAGGDVVEYTKAYADEYNSKLEGYIPAETALTAYTQRLYNAFVALDVTDAQVAAAAALYNSKLKGAIALVAADADETFATVVEAYDYNLSVFGLEEGFTLSARYSNAEAEAYNTANADAIAAGDLAAAVYNTDKPEAKYTEAEATAYNEANADAIAAGELAAVAEGDLKPGYVATLSAANAANQATFGKGARVNGDPKAYTDVDDAKAFNVTLEGAYDVTDDAQKAAFKKNVMEKKVGDKLTEGEAAAYNASLDDAIKFVDTDSDDVPDTWQDAEGNNGPKDEEGNDVVYTDDEAYDFNIALANAESITGIAKAGNKTGTKATDETAAEYNATLDGAVKAGEDNAAADVYYTMEEADAINAAALGASAKTTSTVKTAAGEVAAKANTTLKEVKLPATTKANIVTDKQLVSKEAARGIGAFENCTALATIDFGAAQSIGDYAFLGTALTAIDLSKTTVSSIPATVIVDQKNVTLNNTLASVTLNTAITAIAASTFENCKALKTVTFPTEEEYTKAKTTFATIGSKAFANTALESFTLPASTADAASAIDANAFSGVESLKSFIFLTDLETPNAIVDAEAFPGCKDVIFYTTNTYVAANPTSPKNTSYDISSPDGYKTPFFPTAYKNNPNKYYIKYYATQGIKVKQSEAKVYEGYLDGTDGALNMMCYKAVKGYYEISAGHTVLIITSNKDLEYETGTQNGSWLDLAGQTNELNIVGVLDGKSKARADLDKEAGTGKYVYGWVNSAEKGTGFMKITTGETFAVGTMYVLAGDPAASGRLNVRWYDENGNLESDPTAIQSIQNIDETENGEIYNLQGVRVNGAQKGIFIKNGKKFIVK